MLADLHGIAFDLGTARDWAKEQLLAPDIKQIEPMSIAIAIMYCRPFMEGVRYWLGKKELALFTPEQRTAHEWLRNYRSKYVAHSVNPFEENLPRANYCVERVATEGITSIGYGGGRVIGMSSKNLNDVVELSEVLLKDIEASIVHEQGRLLPIVREMPLDKILAGSQKAFAPLEQKVHDDREQR